MTDIIVDWNYYPPTFFDCYRYIELIREGKKVPKITKLSRSDTTLEPKIMNLEVKKND